MMINFGIDLGTTNSAIAKFDKGNVVVFKNPVGLKDTLPSVVAFRKGRIIVGEKAREYMLKAPDQVAGGFKRKMGTSESYHFFDVDESKTPVELSAQVIKELKNFVHTGEQIKAAVITIPASFDTIQSNATKKAGYLAGFDEVILLQEPIAASLAYANQDEVETFEEGQWMVYDLGGGTFDVALIQIRDGEMKVMDHEGNNFLGGTDFDKKIVERLLVPYLEVEGTFNDLEKEMKSATGKHNKLYQTLLLKAEDAKVQLSTSLAAEIEFETTDDDGNPVDGFLVIERKHIESILDSYIDQTVEMMKNILDRNKIPAANLKFVLMVGGSTYIPYVRTQVAERMGIAVNTQVDPTTAVAVGAAFYAGTKPKKAGLKEDSQASVPIKGALQVKTAYQKATQETQEYFTATFEGKWEGKFYRIIRQDGGYDSGLQPVLAQIEVDLPLVAETFNLFELKVYDDKNNVVPTDAQPIGITQGRYSVVGQPLPNDICLEIDDVENSMTALETLFEKNTLLPARKTIVKQMTRTIAKGSEERLTISITEGSGSALPAASQPIGFISISGKDLTRDLVRGSDVEITLDISESRDLKINAYLMMTDQEFEDVFTPEERRVNTTRLVEELNALADKIRKEILESELQGNFEGAQNLVDIEYDLLDLVDKAKNLTADDVTDDKFQIEDQKRKIAQTIDELTRDKFIIRVKNEYFNTKRYMEYVIETYEPTDENLKSYDQILAEEKSHLATNSSLKIREVIDRIQQLNWRIRWNSSRYIREFFRELSQGRYGKFTQQQKAYDLIDKGNLAIETNDDHQLRILINQLCELLPPAARPNVQFGGTGIG